jgi:hypothetical protein
MTPATDTSAAPDTASGAVPLHHLVDDAALRGRDFWRAVGVTVLATLRPWSR